MRSPGWRADHGFDGRRRATDGRLWQDRLMTHGGRPRMVTSTRTISSRPYQPLPTRCGGTCRAEKCDERRERGQGHCSGDDPLRLAQNRDAVQAVVHTVRIEGQVLIEDEDEEDRAGHEQEHE